MFGPVEPTIKGVMAWAEFTARLPYLKCRPNQRAWIRAYLDSGSEVTATEQTYHCANHLSAYSLSYQVRNAARVRAALACWFGTSIPMLLEETQAHLRSAAPGSIAAQRLLAQKERLIVGEKPPAENEDENSKPQAPAPASTEPKRTQIGDIVIYDGVKHRVTAVDEDGLATAGDPIE